MKRVQCREGANSTSKHRLSSNRPGRRSEAVFDPTVCDSYDIFLEQTTPVATRNGHGDVHALYCPCSRGGALLSGATSHAVAKRYIPSLAKRGRVKEGAAQVRARARCAVCRPPLPRGGSVAGEAQHRHGLIAIF